MNHTRHLRAARVRRWTSTKAHRHRRRTVIRISARNNLERPSLAIQRLVLLRHLHRRLDRLRTSRHEKGSRVLVVIQRRDPTCQFDLGWRRRIRRRRLNRHQLLVHRIRNLPPAISRRLVPKTTQRVQQSIALDVLDPRALAFNENLQLSPPILNLLRVHEQMLASDALQLLDTLAGDRCFGHRCHRGKPPNSAGAF